MHHTFFRYFSPLPCETMYSNKRFVRSDILSYKVSMSSDVIFNENEVVLLFSRLLSFGHARKWRQSNQILLKLSEVSANLQPVGTSKSGTRVKLRVKYWQISFIRLIISAPDLHFNPISLGVLKQSIPVGAGCHPSFSSLLQ